MVVAFGGNALLKRGEPLTMEAQQRNARSAAVAVKQLVDAGYRVCVTHGNGPQVGLLAEQDPAVSECRLQGRCLQQLLMLMQVGWTLFPALTAMEQPVAPVF